MRLKMTLVSALVLASVAAGTGTSIRGTKTGEPAKKFCTKCSPAFPGSIPHCGANGSVGGGGTMGGGGTTSGGGG